MAAPASHGSRADDFNSTARVGRHSRANTVRAKALALSVRRWRWGVRPPRQTRYRAVPLHRVWVWDQHGGRAPSLPDVSEASVGANPRGDPSPTRRRSRNGTMLWFDEANDFGFILTEEGERISVHRSGFLPGETPVGRCAHRGAADCDCAERQARCHRRVDGSGGSARAGATAQLEHSLRVAVMCR